MMLALLMVLVGMVINISLRIKRNLRWRNEGNMLFKASAEKVLIRWGSAKYFVSLASFVAAVLSLPYIMGFITPYLQNYVWGINPGTYLIAWLAMIFVFPEIIYFVMGLFIK